MAKFCEACAVEIGNPYGDFKGLTSEEDSLGVQLRYGK